ncbi:22219_t:CDS:2, partial [Gigaspora margarita]
MKTLNSQLEKEAEWNCFYEYQTISLCVGIVSVSSEILPAIDHILSEYLILQILSIEYMKIAQYVYDARQILLKLMVLKANQDNIKEIWKITNKWLGNNKKKHFIIVLDFVTYMYTCISNISSSRWYCNSKKEAINYENVIFANLNASNTQQGQTMVLIPHSFTVPSVQLAVEYDNDEIEQWLKTFIKHKKRSLQNEESEDGDSNKENISAVANSPITKHRGRPETKRYKAAMEK